MNKKIITIVLCLVLLVSFFLPYLANYSGFDLVFGKYKIGGTNSGLATVLIPLGALLLLFGAWSDNNLTTIGVIWWMPFVGIAFVILMLCIKEAVSIGELIKHFGYGLWLTVAAAIFLPVIKNKS